MFAPVIDRLEAVLPSAERRVFAGAGHVPQETQPGDYTAAILEFTGRY
jgi:pimeloyl-ACP methyl ester carboxylesterase